MSTQPKSDPSVVPPYIEAHHKLASEWVGRNWHDGFKLAGSDSNYGGFWSFVAGYEAATQDTKCELASLADTVASAHRNINPCSKIADAITLKTDLREPIWELSYAVISAQSSLTTKSRECERLIEQNAELQRIVATARDYLSSCVTKSVMFDDWANRFDHAKTILNSALLPSSLGGDKVG